jgi:hypothetical protein
VNRYSLALCATLALNSPQTCATPFTRALRAPEEPVKTAALLLLKKVCAYSCAGSALFFAGHEWGKQKGLEEGFLVGEAHATAQISNQISDCALARANRQKRS